MKRFTLNRPMKIMLIGLGILFGGIFLWKTFQSIMMKRYFASMKYQTVTVSAMKVTENPWQPSIKVVGSLRAILGVNVTTSLAGLVQTIYFKPGSVVNKGDILVQLNADAEIGQLQALEASKELAKITYERDLAQYKVKAVSKQTVDNDLYNYKNLQGQVAQQEAIVAKKTIRAPFSGRLGINYVNPGQYLNVGDKIVSLQSLNPIYADFYVPQQQLSHLKVGQTVNLKIESLAKHKITGKITTIDPMVDVNTRNVLVEATIPNSKQELTPGMFVRGEINVDQVTHVLTLPQTAIMFNPYGDIVFVVNKDKDESEKEILTTKQVFVTVGEKRGDQVTILKGLKKGEMVVTSGQLKLKNGSRVKINNKVLPENNPDPVVQNDEG